jgi:lipoprotein-anchoring transpeptidase ErfK/SrfK
MVLKLFRVSFLLTLVFVGAALFGFLKAGGESADAPSTSLRGTPTPASVAAAREGTPIAAASVAPEPTPQPDRTSCAEIRGTAYRSIAEQQFYLATCQPTPVPGPPTPQPPAIPGSNVPGERWILVDLAGQTATAMVGETPLYTALVTTGKEGWATPRGTFNIVYRVANETMTSSSIGAEEEYVLKDVLYTQYFTTVGHALHLNYWRADSYFGSTPSSHGCVGMRMADAEFFWRFGNVGTRVTIV